MRSKLNNSIGLPVRPNVYDGNLTMSRLLVCMHGVVCIKMKSRMKNSQLKHLRLVLACIVVLAVHGFFLIEQPRQTHLFNYFRWQWFQERICYVPCLHI